MAKKKTKVEVEETPRVVETPIVETPKPKKVETKSTNPEDNWEIKDRMYYLKNNAPSPAINRFSVIIKDYQGSSIIPQTLYRMYEAFEMLKLKDKSEQTYLILKYNFPKR